MQIIILGMHRSGTSMVARLVNMLGAYMGPERATLEHRSGRLDPHNARGHWERADVMDINNAILHAAGARWDMPKASRPLQLQTLPVELQQKLELLIYGMDANRPWMVKDPRLCLTLPCWQPLLDMPVALLVYRHPLEIAASLAKRNGMPLEKGLALWEYYVCSALNHTQHMPRLYINHSALLSDPVRAVHELYESLTGAGVRRLELPSPRETLAFVDPRLNHSSQNTKDLLALSAGQQHLIQLMQSGLPQFQSLQCSGESLALLTA